MGEIPKIQTRKSKGFRKTGSLVETRLRRVGESRGFAVTRLVTHWEDVVGPDMGRICTPVKVGYAQKGFGATLTLLTTGAQAPMLEMQLDQIRAKVNACYGYNAISRVRLTQTAPVGFKPAIQKNPSVTRQIPVETQVEADHTTKEIKNPELRAALAAFGANVMTQERKAKP